MTTNEQLTTGDHRAQFDVPVKVRGMGTFPVRACATIQVGEQG